MADSTGFFNRAPAVSPNQRNTSEYSYISIGGRQFHAIAVALIDCFQNNTRGNEPVIKKILERLYHYFPKYVSHQPYLTPGERMGVLIHSARKSELVECMSYVIRQITVDELYAHPLNYREAFDGLNANTSKAHLRQSDVLFAPSILRALSQALGITLNLSFVEEGKELRKRATYTGNAMGGIPVILSLQVQGSHYFPKVKNGVDFAYVGQLAIKSPEPVVDKVAEETISDIISLIALDNKRLLRTYSQWQQNLSTMLQEELKTEDLLQFYVHSLPGNNGVIADSVQFFAQLSQTTTKPINMSFPTKLNQINTSLVNAIAAAISIGEIDADQLDILNETPARTASPAA